MYAIRSYYAEYNEAHGIVPTTIAKGLENVLEKLYASADDGSSRLALAAEEAARYGDRPEDLAKEIKRLERDMRKCAEKLEFEKAAELRDRMARLKDVLLELG